MGKMSWRTPPPVVAIGGTETFLLSRQIRNAVRVTENDGRRVVWADSDEEVSDIITSVSTFGDPCLIVVDVGNVSDDTIEALVESPPKKTCVLITVQGKMDEKKWPVLARVHGAYQVSNMAPTDKKGKRTLAVRFARAEAATLMGNKDALDSALAEGLVSAAGTDLGTLSFEISKAAALARYQDSKVITVAHVKALVRASTDVDMTPLREGLRARNVKEVAKALARIRAKSSDDPVMLLLRAKGAPADLALKWLRAALLLENGASPSEIAIRTDTPEWAVKKDVIPAARKWGSEALRELVSRLSRVDRGVLQGVPSPWVSCETALLLGCVG